MHSKNENFVYGERIMKNLFYLLPALLVSSSLFSAPVPKEIKELQKKYEIFREKTNTCGPNQKSEEVTGYFYGFEVNDVHLEGSQVFKVDGKIKTYNWLTCDLLPIFSQSATSLEYISCKHGYSPTTSNIVKVSIGPIVTDEDGMTSDGFDLNTHSGKRLLCESKALESGTPQDSKHIIDKENKFLNSLIGESFKVKCCEYMKAAPPCGPGRQCPPPPAGMFPIPQRMPVVVPQGPVIDI